MAEIQTKKTGASVDAFVAAQDEGKQADCHTVIRLMEKATKSKAEMWGPAIIGFGKSTLRYSDGREIDWMQIAFSPRKQNMTLYLEPGFDGKDELLAKLGKHTTSKACLYIKKLADVDLKVLEKMIVASVKQSKANAAR